MFTKPKTEVVIIEVDKSIGRLPEMTGDLRESLRALQHSPAFQYLLKRFELERATLKKYLDEGFNLSEQQLHHLQAGVHYLGYISTEIKKLTSTPSPAASPAQFSEREAFDRVRASLDIVT